MAGKNDLDTYLAGVEKEAEDVDTYLSSIEGEENSTDGVDAYLAKAENPDAYLSRLESTEKEDPSFWDKTKEAAGEFIFGPEKKDEGLAPIRLNKDVRSVTDDEIASIAERRGVSPEELKEMIPIFGGVTLGKETDVEDIAKQTASKLSDALAFGVPQFAYKKMQDESMRHAIDDLRGIIDEKKSTAEAWVGGLGEFGVGTGAALKLGKLAGLGAAKFIPGLADEAVKAYEIGGAIGGGATAMTATSNEGDELRSAGAGALFGGAVVGTLMTPAAIRAARRALTKGSDTAVAAKADEFINTDAGANVVAKAEEKVAQTAPTDDKYIAEIINDANSLQIELPSAKPKGKVATKADEASLFKEFDYDKEIIRPKRTKTAEGSEAPKAPLKDNLFGDFDAKIPKAQEAASEGMEKKVKAKVRKGPVVKEDGTKVENSTSKLVEFADYLTEHSVKIDTKIKTDEDALKVVRQALDQEGPDHVKMLYTQKRFTDEFKEVMHNAAVEQSPSWLKMPRRFMRALTGDKTFARYIDDKVGTRLEPLLDELSRQNNAYSVHMASAREQIKGLATQLSKTGMDINDLYRLLDKGGEAATPEQQVVVEGFRSFFKEKREEAIKLGLKIDEREYYIPHKLMETPQLVATMKQVGRALEKEVGVKFLSPNLEIGDDVIEKIKATNMGADYLKVMQMITGRKYMSPKTFNEGVKFLHDPELMNEKVYDIAAATLRRDGEIPLFVRETNPVRLAEKWASNTFHHAYFRDGMAKLETQNAALKAAKAFEESDYMTVYIRGLRGKKTGLNAWISKAMSALESEFYGKALEADSPFKNRLYSVVSQTPELFRWFQGNMYPYFLGLRPKSVLTNLSGNLAMTVPEMGTAYAGPKAIKSLAHTAKISIDGEEITVQHPAIARKLSKEMKKEVKVGDKVLTRNIDTILENEGLLSTQAHALMHAKDGLYTSPKLQDFRNLTDKGADLAMLAFAKAESLNRFMARDMADSVTDDILKLVKAADKVAPEIEAQGRRGLKYVNRMGAGYRQNVMKAIKAGDDETVKKLIREYTISKNALNYNRFDSSEFARVVGPFFSMFTKWPIAITGEMAEAVRKKDVGGMSHAARKFLTPLIAFYAMDRLINMASTGDAFERGPTTKAWLGGSIASSAPISSPVSMFTGEMFAPPMVSYGTDFVKALLKATELGAAGEDASAPLWKWATDSGASVLPGGVFLRFFFGDAPKLLGWEDEE